MRWLVPLLRMSCASTPSIELAIDLRSDYLPAVDLDRVEVFVDVGRLGRMEETVFAGDESLLSGHRVAEFVELPRHVPSASGRFSRQRRRGEPKRRRRSSR